MAIAFGDPTGLNKGPANHCLHVSRSRKTGEITDVTIVPNEGISDASAITELGSLATAWKAELTAPLQDSYAFEVLFSRGKPKGHYTLSPWFSIREMPEGCPVLPRGGQWHPFILTFRYRALPTFTLKKKAEMRHLRGLIQFLNVVIPLGVSTGPWGFAWSIDAPKAQGEPATSAFRQLGYIPGRLDIKTLSALPTEPSTMPVVSDAESYSFLGPQGVDGLFIPSCMPEAFEKFSKLSPDLAKAFAAAARHLALADKVVDDSISYGYIALVSAIETLANTWSEHWWPSESCETCDQPRRRLSLRYREFLKTYAGVEGAAMYRQFYESRSLALHAGTFLLAESKGLWDAGFEGIDAHPNFRYLRNATRVAMLNWLENPLCEPRGAGHKSPKPH